MNKELRERLRSAKSLDEVKKIIAGQEGLNAERIWQEIEKHASGKNEKLDLEELDAVAGGADRDWKKDGCAATCEGGSWCWSNDRCAVWDVTYDNFWSTCPDGSEHEWCAGAGYVCVKCGYNRSL